MRHGFSIFPLIIAAALPAFAAEFQTISLTLAEGRPVVDNVYLNGRGPFRFLLDTGAQTNQVAASLAGELGLVPKFRVELATAAGSSLVPGGRMREVRLGGAKAEDQEVLLTDLAGVRMLDPGIDGVLGQEFLARFDYLLDFRNRQITLGAAIPHGEKIPCERRDGSLLVPTSEGKMILDSGTDTLVLFRSLSGVQSSRIATAAGFAAAGEPRVTKLRVGKRTYKPDQTAAIGTVNSRGAGLLPAALLGAVFVSNSGGFLVLTGQ